MYFSTQGEVHPSPFLAAFYMAELREAPSTDGAIFPMGLGPAVAQVGAAEQGPAVELGQAERGPAEQGPAVAQVELGAVAELRPVEQWRSWSQQSRGQQWRR